jgi:hypothetical protein
MSKRTDDWRRAVVRAVVDRHELTGAAPTLGELSAVLGWSGDIASKQSHLRHVLARGLVAVTPTLPRRIVVTSLGAQLLESGK